MLRIETYPWPAVRVWRPRGRSAVKALSFVLVRCVGLIGQSLLMLAQFRRLTRMSLWILKGELKLKLADAIALAFQSLAGSSLRGRSQMRRAHGADGA